MLYEVITVKDGVESIWKMNEGAAGLTLDETLYVTDLANGEKLYNGAAKEEGKFSYNFV